MVRRKTNFDFTAGWLIATELSATGGVRYEREALSEETKGRGLEAEFKTKKIVDDVELVKESRAVISRAYYVLQRHCAHTPIGWFADKEMLEALEKEFTEVREGAQAFNEVARELGSARRFKAEIYALDVSVDNEVVAERLATLVRERLQDLQGALESSDAKQIKEAFERCRNLEKLATGIQRDSISMALDHAREQRRLVKEGQPLSFGPIQAAVHLFESTSLKEAA